MRKLLAFGVLVVLATPANAQRTWQPEIGVQGGFSSFKAAGTGGNASTLIDLPGGTLTSILSYAPLYAIIPIGKRLALEPQLGALQVNLGSNTATLARVGLRFDYGFGPGLYGAAGGVLNYLDQGNPGHTQVGLQVGVGYRTHVAGPLNGRIEANWVSTHASDVTQAFNAYSVLLGISATLRQGTSARPTRASAAKAWSPELGIVGGYGSAHVVGTSNDITGVFFPGGANSFEALGPGAPAPATLFAILPVGGKWAIEPSFDLHHLGQSGSNATSFEVGARIDYAATGGWYAAAGGQLTNINPATGSSGSLTSAIVAWGNRFHLAGPTGGRVEVNYMLTGKNDKIGIPPVNTLSFLFGLTMPLQ